jgi:tripartite-type tricarboxylate transporter receptor subunit TctC
MSRMHWFLGWTLIAAAPAAWAQDYPTRPVRIVTPEAGGNGDFNARLIAQGLTGALGQAVVVENKGGTVLAGQTVANAAPDGYTLLVLGSSFWVSPLLQKISYDVVRDFAPISSISNSPIVLVIYPSLPVKSVKELIALAKSKPGALNYAGGAVGGAQHIAGELFKSMAGVDVAAIPYKAEGPGLQDVMGGRVQFMFASAAATAPLVKSGRLTALGVGSTQPSALFPDVPPIAATVAGYESGSKQGIWAPAKTPVAIINRLNREIGEILSKPDVKARLLTLGIEAAPSTPEQFSNVIKTDIARTAKLIAGIGLKSD